MPALGGDWFLTPAHFTRFGAHRQSGYHLVFRSGAAGGVLVVLAHTVVLCLDRVVPAVAELWGTLVPFDYSGTFLLSALLGIALPPICNRLYDAEKAASRAAEEAGDLVELLMAESIRLQKLIEVSLKSGKVYIGYALDVEPPVRGECDVAIIPLWSGYRNKDTCELTITTNYAPLIQRRLNAPSTLGDYRVVIPKSELASARFFDMSLYKAD
ncbi:MAG: hypothetical protein OXG35_10295 [Acidobacteria bacterium]|nr:hypothetical protein [Acidobacteriota bacterium]